MRYLAADQELSLYRHYSSTILRSLSLLLHGSGNNWIQEAGGQSDQVGDRCTFSYRNLHMPDPAKETSILQQPTSCISSDFFGIIFAPITFDRIRAWESKMEFPFSALSSTITWSTFRPSAAYLHLRIRIHQLSNRLLVFINF